MNSTVRRGVLAGCLATVALVAAVSSPPHATADEISVPGPTASTGLVAGSPRIDVGPVVSPAVVAADRTTGVRRTSYRVFDDRDLNRRTAGWSSVAAGSAFRDTLTCGSGRGQTLRLPRIAAEGGGVRVQTGSGRGSIAIVVGGTTVARASTAASSTGFRTIGFPGAGRVDIRISTGGKRVCIDSARLVVPESVLSGPLRQLGLNASGQGPDNEVINAEVSPAGTMVAFWSRAGNLVPGTNDGVMRLFVARVSTGKVMRVIATDPQSTDGSRAIAWSPVYQGDTDGRYLVFGSAATNLGPDVSGRLGPFMYLYDFEQDSIGFLAEGVSSAAFSPDGQKIAFATRAQYGSDPNSDDDLWSLDLRIDPSEANLTGISTRSDGSFPTSTPTGSWQPSWSPDSEKVLFTSFSASLVANDTNVSRDVFMKNLTTGVTSRVSLGRSGAQLNSYSEHGTFSPDGRLIAFTSAADNVVTGDTNAGLDVYTRVLSTGQVGIVSTTSSGEPALFDHYRPHWSPDGTRIAYMSAGVDLLPDDVDTNQRKDVYIKNLVTGQNQLVSVTADGRIGNADSSTFVGEYSDNAWLPDGRGLVFISRSTNLAASNNNGFSMDIFLKAL